MIYKSNPYLQQSIKLVKGEISPDILFEQSLHQIESSLSTQKTLHSEIHSSMWYSLL
jgi:hypothetical protein